MTAKSVREVLENLAGSDMGVFSQKDIDLALKEIKKIVIPSEDSLDKIIENSTIYKMAKPYSLTPMQNVKDLAKAIHTEMMRRVE